MISEGIMLLLMVSVVVAFTLGWAIGQASSSDFFLWLTERRRMAHAEHMAQLKLEAKREELMFESTQWHVPKEKP